MAPEMEKPRVTEIKVRMDCNGCVQKIKKALGGITGIYDIYIDFPQQKVTIIGWADPHKLVKAIKKTRKSAVICVHTEQSDDQPAQPTEPTPDGVAAPEGEAPPPSEPTNPPAEPTQTESTPPEEAPINQREPENPPPESANTTSQYHPDFKPEDHEDVHVIYHHPTDYGYRYGGQWNSYHGGPVFRGKPSQPPQPVYVTQSYNTSTVHHGGPEFRGEPSQPPEPVYVSHGCNSSTVHHGGPGFRGEPSQPPEPIYASHGYNSSTVHHGGPRVRGEPPQRPQPVYVSHSYNTYKPSPYVTEYIYPRSPTTYSFYSRPDNYSQDYYRNYGNSNITSMFSEENPNACRIV